MTPEQADKIIEHLGSIAWSLDLFWFAMCIVVGYRVGKWHVKRPKKGDSDA